MDRVAPAEQIMPMARGAGLNLVGAACTKLVLLAITVALSWELGTTAVGRYAQAYALLMVLVAVAGLPLGAGATRFVAMYRADGDDAATRGAARLAVGGTLVCALLLAAPLFAGAGFAAHHLFHDLRLTTPLRLVAAALPPAAVAEAALAATVGFSRMRPRAVVKMVLEPVMRLALTLGLMLVGVGLTGAMLALVASSSAAAVLAVRALGRYLGRFLSPPAGPPRYEPRTLFAFSLVSGTAWLALNGLQWADTLILGALRSSADVGVYTVATRIVVLAAFVFPAVTQAFAPRITDLDRRGRRAELRDAYRVATGWTLTLSLPAFAVLLAFPHELLRLFGDRFAAAAAVTVLLAVGQMVDAATGPCGMMLTMSGRPGWGLADNVATLVLNVVLNLVLIPPFGIVGAAVAWSLSLVVVNLARVVQVWLVLRMLPFELGQLRTLAAAAAAAGCGLLAARSLEGPARLLAGMAAVFGAYLLALAVLHRRRKDRVVVAMLAQQTAAFLTEASGVRRRR